MPTLPSWKFHEVSFSPATGETVVTRPSNRSKAEVSRLAKRTKERFDAAFPSGFSAQDYAAVLIAHCASFEPASRSEAVGEAITKLVSLERLCFAHSNAERANYFRLSKRIFVSKILTPVLSRMEDGEYRKSNYKPWSDWILNKAFTDISDFWFWSSWQDRFETGTGHIRQEDFPLNF